MKRALVTGGCGFLGAWISRYLCEAGVRVRVLALPGETRQSIADLDVEIVEGNVLDRESCLAAVDGVDTVFHAAAVYDDWMQDPTPMYRVNMRGTFNVLEAARRASVKRVVYTASIAAIGRPDSGHISDERTAFEGWDVDFAYARSKLHSMEIAEYFADWGLDVRIVCPGFILGPGDLRPTPSGQVILTALQGQAAVFYYGGIGYVDVRDCARVHLLAADKGRAGQRYIASGHNLDNGQFMAAVDSATRKRRPRINLPIPVARSVAIAMEQVALRTGRRPLLSRNFFEYSLKPLFVSNEKAQRELGATFRPIEETIVDAVADFRARGVAR